VENVIDFSDGRVIPSPDGSGVWAFTLPSLRIAMARPAVRRLAAKQREANGDLSQTR
jgi:hypothetical protein